MNLSPYIDYTILKQDCTQAQIATLCATALQHQYKAVCIPPMYVSYAKMLLHGNTTAVKICSVVGFPLGYQLSDTKITEAKALIQAGAEELDIVINVSEIKNKHLSHIQQELSAFVTLCREHNIISKVIIECTLLDEHEIREICYLLNLIKPNFAKTSTGFTGISIWDEKHKVAIMREVLIPEIALKISGGVRTKEQATYFIAECGAERIGTSVIL